MRKQAGVESTTSPHLLSERWQELDEANNPDCDGSQCEERSNEGDVAAASAACLKPKLISSPATGRVAQSGCLPQ